MTVEIEVDVGGRILLMDIEPHTLAGLKKEFDEFCSEDRALQLRLKKYSPTFSMHTHNDVLVEVKRKHAFQKGEKVFIRWTPLELKDGPESQVLEQAPEKKTKELLKSQPDTGDEHMETSESEDEYGLVKEYFTDSQWAKMPKYQRLRQKNKFGLHEQKLEAGLDVGPFKPEEIDRSISSPESCCKRKRGFSSDDEDEVDALETHEVERNPSKQANNVLRPVDGNKPGPSKAGDNLLGENVGKIKPELPQYDIPKILEEESNTGNDDIKGMIKSLNQNGILTGKSRRMLIRILTRHLFFKIAKNPKEATPDMREGLAKSIVMHFPKFGDPCDVETSYPWKSLFERGMGRGWIANAARSIQKKFRTKRSKKSRVAQLGEDVDEDSDDASEKLALLMPGRAERRQILDGMTETFPQRRAARRNRQFGSQILKKFPHLASYDGEVLQEEFKLMKPDAQDMSLNFQRKIINILALETSSTISLPVEDDVIKALIIMSRKLPRDVSSRTDPKGKSTAADLQDILEIVQLGQDIDAFVSQKVEDATGPIQPYLIMVRSPTRNATVKCFLVLDEKPVQIPSTSTVKCFELLLKAYFVFNVKYPLGWRATMHCLATCFAKIFEDRGPSSRPDSVTPSERDFLNTIL